MGFPKRGGGNRRGGNRGGKGKSGAEYIYSSSLTLNLMDDGEKVKVGMADAINDLNDANKTEAESLELAISLTRDKADRFIELLQAAQEDPEGDGGIRLQMYLKEGENPDTGEVFDSGSIMVMGKFPPKNGRGGNRRGKGGGGRRDYDDKEESPRGRKTARTRSGDDDDQEEENEDVNEDTNKRGRASRGDRTPDSSKGGRGKTATKRASRAEEEDEEEMEPVKSPYKDSKKKSSRKGKSEEEEDDDVPY